MVYLRSDVSLCSLSSSMDLIRLAFSNEAAIYLSYFSFLAFSSSMVWLIWLVARANSFYAVIFLFSNSVNFSLYCAVLLARLKFSWILIFWTSVEFSCRAWFKLYSDDSVFSLIFSLVFSRICYAFRLVSSLKGACRSSNNVFDDILTSFKSTDSSQMPQSVSWVCNSFFNFSLSLFLCLKTSSREQLAI